MVISIKNHCNEFNTVESVFAYNGNWKKLQLTILFYYELHPSMSFVGYLIFDYKKYFLLGVTMSIIMNIFFSSAYTCYCKYIRE